MIELNETTDFRNVIDTLFEYAEEFKTRYIEKLRADNRKATERLINSVSTDVKIGNLLYTVTFNAAEYYKYIENGTKPHRPPVDAILKWIQTKPILPRPMANGKLPTEKQLAYLIGRAIAINGTIKDKGYQGGKYIEETVDELNGRYLVRLQEALQRDFDAYAIRIFGGVNKALSVIG